MSIQDLINWAGSNSLVMLLTLMLPFVGTILWASLHPDGHGGRSPWKYGYTLLVYSCCIPGMASAVLLAYTVFFLHTNLLHVAISVYFLPLIMMILDIILLKKFVDFDDVPGFDRLRGLMLILACTFALAIGISKTRIWVVFGGSFSHLIGLLLVIFVLLKLGSHMLFRRSNGRF